MLISAQLVKMLITVTNRITLTLTFIHNPLIIFETHEPFVESLYKGTNVTYESFVNSTYKTISGDMM